MSKYSIKDQIENPTIEIVIWYIIFWPLLICVYIITIIIIAIIMINKKLFTKKKSIVFSIDLNNLKIKKL